MTRYDFLFSARSRIRFLRHTTFWAVWWVYFLLTYFFPHYLFPSWQFQAKLLKIGFWRFMAGASANAVPLMVNMMLLTYAVIYFLLPRYFLKRRYPGFAVGILLLTTLSIPFIYYTYFWYNRPVSQFFYGHSGPATANYIYNCCFSFILFNFPTVVGVAVSIKLLTRWWLKQQETELLLKEKTKAELQLLKARIHPHFLFNSLNNIYSFALEGSPKTMDMIRKLTDLLHYMIHECNQPEVSLGRELKMIQDYILLEKIRYGDRLKLDIRIPENLQHGRAPDIPLVEKIAPLLLIPFVENSFKHGTSKMLSHPSVSLSIHVEESTLYFRLSNNKPAGKPETAVSGNHGLGLKNVKKRLSLLYPGRHELRIAEESTTYSVSMKIVMKEPLPLTKKFTGKKEKTIYEPA